MGIKRMFKGLSLALLCVLPSVSGATQEWPARPVTVVIPYPAGGMADVVARIVTTELTKELGQPFIAVPRPGANSNIAANAVASAKPDGYTLLVTGPWLAINQYIETGRRWELDNFVPVARFALTDNILAIPGTSKASTLAEYIQSARHRDTAALHYASPGTGSTQRMAAELFLKEANIHVDSVQYKGAPPIIPDLVSGRVSMAVLAAGNVTALIKSGQLKGLATFGEKRGPNTSSVPTMIELGYPKAIATSWFGLHAPASTPEKIINHLADAIQKIVQKPDVQEMLHAADAQAAFLGTREFSRFIRGEQALWSEVASGIEGKQ